MCPIEKLNFIAYASQANFCN